MADRNEEIRKRIIATFQLEAAENSKKIYSILVELENGCSDERRDEILEQIYRSAHSLKGAARAVGFVEIESLCHAFEDLMYEIRENKIEMSPALFDVFHQTMDLCTEAHTQQDNIITEELDRKIIKHIELLSTIDVDKLHEIEVEKISPAKEVEKKEHKTSEEEASSREGKAVDDEVVKKNEELPDSQDNEKVSLPKTIAQSSIQEKNSSIETIRVAVSKLDNILLQTEELLSLKQNIKNYTSILHSVSQKLNTWIKEASHTHSSVFAMQRKLGRVNDSIGSRQEEMLLNKMREFKDWTESYFESLEREVSDFLTITKEQEFTANAKIDTLLRDSKDLLAVPFSTLLSGFPKMVRDIAAKLNKKIVLEIEGDGIEIDRRILEGLRDAITHLLRNAIDYGIEHPKDRLAKQKSEEGHIRMQVRQLENKKIVLSISDDGSGIDLQKLRELYKKKEKNSEIDVEQLSDKQMLDYMFKSGISTSTIITDISGRGLGLAIVHEAVTNVGGKISIETKKDIGSSFHLELPVLVVTFRGILIRSNDSRFIVPAANVHRVLRIQREEILSIENRPFVSIDGKTIPLASMAAVLELPEMEWQSDYLQLLVFKLASTQFACIVEGIEDNLEVQVKHFNRQLSRVRNVSGAIVLGSGEVVPVLNIQDIYLSILNNSQASRLGATSGQMEGIKQKSLLIVEDSITSRTLLKNVLEAEGYKVQTAIDGVDGFTKYKEMDFDALISDIEMPRMNGFDLVEKVRSDVKNPEIPIVLISSLSRREDKEKGIDVGANAYIIKSSFDQNTLFETLERLI